MTKKLLFPVNNPTIKKSSDIDSKDSIDFNTQEKVFTEQSIDPMTFSGPSFVGNKSLEIEFLKSVIQKLIQERLQRKQIKKHVIINRDDRGIVVSADVIETEE